MDEIQVERQHMLEENVKNRRREIMHYQVNIDNYRLAIEEIKANHATDPAMLEFSKQLEGLLATSLIEQMKEKIILKVIEKQLGIVGD